VRWLIFRISIPVPFTTSSSPWISQSSGPTGPAAGPHLAAESIGQEGPMEAGRDWRSRVDLRDSQDEGTWIKGHGHDGHVPKLEFVGYCWTKWGLIRHRDGMMELGMLDHNAFPQVLLECVESMNLSILDLDKFGSLVILNLNLRSN
jgi:hypothetical protein